MPSPKFVWCIIFAEHYEKQAECFNFSPWWKPQSQDVIQLACLLLFFDFPRAWPSFPVCLYGVHKPVILFIYLFLLLYFSYFSGAKQIKDDRRLVKQMPDNHFKIFTSSKHGWHQTKNTTAQTVNKFWNNTFAAKCIY